MFKLPPGLSIAPASTSSTAAASETSISTRSVSSSPTTLNTSASEATATTEVRDDVASTTIQPPETNSRAANQAPNNGISGGAVAGVAIGCLLLGLALGALAVFFFCRRHGKKRRHHRRPRGEFLAEKENSPRESPPTAINLDHFLLDTTPDKEIVSELRALGHLVSMHVDNNYHHQPVPTDASSLAASISKLGFHAGSANTIASLCCNPQTRAVGLRHFISQVIFTSIDFNARSPLSMLPAPVAAFLASIPVENEVSDYSTEKSLAFSEWRALSAFLLHPNRAERTPLVPSEAAIIPQAQGLTSALNTVLGIFLSHHESQVEHLQAVILEFTNFGYVLLSQPGDFRFVYEASGQDASDRAIVVCAGLERLSRRDGGSVVSSSLVRAPEVVLI
ncbi:hypothetical protein B0J13DRAFT_598509 [Dactylonectria estremocensis]|uniref:Uncharacterized protein n=1 Tax=Dactylonectria estremocensis TaxID=1079267 RepID=A0A9P9E2I1_9HYPO|nr:hypothetical protein B0J13DRAFT_598509 [Dactylonectria estremocensis]